MFSKKSHLDIKKSTTKIQDAKKDLATRLKHLKIILDNVDISEAKGIFETNFSHIYHILYESFVEAETHLRQRVHKAYKEELECSLWILEQILSLVPELLHKRWQIHSLGRMLLKLLHPGNSIRLRRQAVRYFLMWYQALNDNAPDYVNEMYASLVPGFANQTISMNQNGSSVFHDSIHLPVTPAEVFPILPPSSGEKPPENPSRLFLETLLDYMVSTVVRLEWHDRASQHHKCFNFLLEKFKFYYLPTICPNFSYETSLYNPNLELPCTRKPEIENEFVACRVTFIKWIATYMQQTRKNGDAGPPSLISTHSAPTSNLSSSHEDEQNDSAHPSLEYSLSIQSNKTSDEELSTQIVRDVLCNSRDNVNFVHEIYRQAFLLNFGHAIAIRKTIAVYKDLIQMNVNELPPYMVEPPEGLSDDHNSDGHKPARLRNDSYIGAILKENLFVRAGVQNVLQIFMTHASNVFLLEVGTQFSTLLEEQTDACKRVLNIYRYMVMHTRMDSNTWEQLLVVLLQITSLVLNEFPPKKKMQTLGGKLAPAIFQTLIVTWIKANLNVMISRELWDRFLHVLTSLTSWEELVKEWAKTLDTLTRVLARHVYNLDLSDLPLDRLLEQKSRRSRRVMSRPEMSTPCSISDSSHPPVSRQDSTIPDGNLTTKHRVRHGLTRSLSDNNLSSKRKHSSRPQNRPRRFHSLDNLRQCDSESTDRTRSPSPAPSSGIESNSIKDSPIQLDVLASENIMQEISGEHRGVVCGGSVRGWLPDVAVVLWKRMLGSLGDVNQITDAKLHSQVFDYFVKLTDTLIKIKQNQGVSPDNQSTPQPPELVPPLTLILPWCFEALSLPNAYEAGKLSALRLLCTITLNCDSQHRTYLPHFYRALHIALCGTSKASLNIVLRHLGPRFLSLQLPGSSILLLDLIQACNTVLNSNDISHSTPRTEAVSILANLLSFPDDLSQVSVLQPEPHIQVMPCPDIKEHVVTILLRAGRREPTGRARCIALSALGTFIYKEFSNKTFHPKVSDAINVLLLALKFNNKMIAQLTSNILFLLCDHAADLWAQYPRLADSIIRTLCSALFLHAPLGSTAGDNDKALSTALLLCLGEWCMGLGPNRLLTNSNYGEANERTCLLLLVFTVLHKLVTGQTFLESKGGLTQPSMSEDFDPNILLDNLEKLSPTTSPSKNYQCQQAIILCAKTVLSHLVTHLGHFPMAIGAARLSSLVAEHDDVPNLVSDELCANIFTAPNIQLFVLTPNVISSLIELPILDLPGGGVTAGLSTADKQVRVLLRDISGKACWDASILYRNPDSHSFTEDTLDDDSIQTTSTVSSKWGPISFIQPESLMITSDMQPHLPQRAIRHRASNILPDTTNAAPDLDQLDDLLQYLGHTSPECLESFDHKLNEPVSFPVWNELETEAIGCVINQRNTELEQSKLMQHIEGMMGQPATKPDNRAGYEITCIQQAPAGIVEQTAFQQCRLLFSQLGLAGWERRRHLHLLNKTERLLRELRNLDTQRCRETHKVAVIYIAPGQEDKNSILSNQGGSADYEQFLASLAWEVELEGHTGFLGGLQRQGSNGVTAPYVATSFHEAIFHVATRMPGDTTEAVLTKTRHLGNDEVHIVWSEHNREYRRDIIPTEFCDILITIYPLGNHLNRVTVNCKPEVPHFGVLFSEAIVESNVLAGLVRATVICASRAKRTTLPFYQQYYEERAKSLDTVMTKHKDNTTYEDFISRVYSPIAMPSPFCIASSISNGSGEGSACTSNTSMLAAALLDSHGHSHKVGHKPEQKFRVSDSSKGVWFNHNDISQSVESTSISPRPLKKLSTSLKSVPRRSLRQELASDSPPESPTQMTRKK